jgi:DNA polymerase-3 subunit delta
MRALFEKSAGAAAVACFADEARDLDAMVGAVLAAEKLQITPEAKRLLIANLGADRALSRAEVEKLALFVRGKTLIDERDVETAVGDAAEIALDRVVMAAAAGRPADAVRELSRSVGGGESAQALIAAVQRHFLRLHRLRGAYDGGRSLEEAIQSLRPPLHFRQRAAVESQCRAWSLLRLTAALASIAQAAEAARRNSAMEDTLAEHLLLRLGELAGLRKS